MKVEYKRDLHHSFMILSEINDSTMESYCIKMLSFQKIEGILPLEQHTINNKILLYYDITAKQSMMNVFDKAVLSYSRVKNILLGMIHIIERAYDYLLMENDFILMPEYIYLDVTNEKPSLCYLPGYQKDIKEQMCAFIEYIMDKIDYKDREAVLLVYRLYAISKEEGLTFGHIQNVIQSHDYGKNSGLSSSNHSKNRQDDNASVNKGKGKDKLDGMDKPDDIDRLVSMGIATEKNGIVLEDKEKPKPEKKPNIKIPNINIPVMMERLTGEKEVFCYPLKTYLITILYVLGGILIFVLGIFTKVFYNSFGNRIDYSKLFAFLLILLCLESFLIKKTWDKKHRITKIVTHTEYIDPRQDLAAVNSESKEGNMLCEGPVPWEANHGLMEYSLDYNFSNRKELFSNDSISDYGEEDYNPTCLLNPVIKEESDYFLQPLDAEQFERIKIKEIPFFIGKLQKNVDYCLKKDVVSRYHAKITKEEDHFYITDLNSTNGTFVNGDPLITYQPKEICPGDEIAFADIKYRFIVD